MTGSSKGSLPHVFRQFGWLLCPGLIGVSVVQAWAVWTGDTSYLGTGFWHRYPLLSLWMVLSCFLAILCVAVAAVVLWIRWGRGSNQDRLQVAAVSILIVCAYAMEHWAVERLL